MKLNKYIFTTLNTTYNYKFNQMNFQERTKVNTWEVENMMFLFSTTTPCM